MNRNTFQLAHIRACHRCIEVSTKEQDNVFIETIQLADQFASQVDICRRICKERRRQGCRLEPTPYMDVSVTREAGCRKHPWMYSRRFPEDMPGDSDALARTE